MPAREFPAQTAPTRGAASRFTFLLGAVCWLACPPPAHADGQLWVLASVTKTLASEWRVGVDFATRWEDGVSDYSRSVLRAQAARAIGSQVWLGVGYEFTEPASVLTRREHRIWQQVDIRQHLGAWTLSHRGRLEQRWLHLAPSMVVRTRYQFRAAHPIARSRRWSWQVLDEVLYTVRGTPLGPEQGLDRHRLGGGIARVLTDHVTVEAGYTWQVINRPRQTNQHDHLAILTMAARY